MFEVTEQASKKISEILKGKGTASAIRVVLSEGGCSGSSLAMFLDKQKDGDEVFNEHGITYVIERKLLEWVKPIMIDYGVNPMGAGFIISSRMPPGGSCAHCSCSK
jgi:iron-sulfur cluster assembly protein